MSLRPTRPLQINYRVPTLTELLQKMSFAYPYHQSIGFYLQRVGRSWLPT